MQLPSHATSQTSYSAEQHERFRDNVLPVFRPISKILSEAGPESLETGLKVWWSRSLVAVPLAMERFSSKRVAVWLSYQNIVLVQQLMV